MDEYQLLEEIDPAEVIQDTDKLVGTSGATAKSFSFGLIKEFLAELFVKKEDVQSEGIEGSDDPVSSDALYNLKFNLDNYKSHVDEWFGDILDELKTKSNISETVSNVRYEDGTFYQEIDGNEQEICIIKGLETVDAVTAGNMNPVTSNAVEIKMQGIASGITSYPTTQGTYRVTGGFTPVTNANSYGTLVIFGKGYIQHLYFDNITYKLYWGKTDNNVSKPTNWQEVTTKINGLTFHSIKTNQTVTSSTPYTFNNANGEIVQIAWSKATGGNTIRIEVDGNIIYSFPNYTSGAISDNVTLNVRKNSTIKISCDGSEWLICQIGELY